LRWRSGRSPGSHSPVSVFGRQPARRLKSLGIITPRSTLVAVFSPRRTIFSRAGQLYSCPGASATFPHTVMSSDEMFNWPDGDVILRATHGTDSRDFRVHKLFLSFASPIFKDMFKVPQPSPSSSNVDIIDVTDPPRTLELILRFIYPFASPVINDLTTLSDVLILADKYDIEAARSRLRPCLAELAKTEPLRVYAIACRLGFEDEMKIASSHTTSIDLSELTQLPEEFKPIPSTEYHRLVRLRGKYRKAVVAIAARKPFSNLNRRVPIVDCVMKGAPLEYDPFAAVLKKDFAVDVEYEDVENQIRSFLVQVKALNLTV